MITINISLSESMKEFIDSEIAEGGYESANEYFVRLVRAEQKRKAREKLESLLFEGLESPIAEYDPNEISDIKQRLCERHKL